MKPITFPYMVSRGSVTVKIYRTPSHGCESFTLSYYQDGARKRPTFPTFEGAKQEAELVAGQLASSSGDVLTLTSADRAAYLRATELLSSQDIPLEVAVGHFVEARKALGDIPLSQAVTFYLSRHPKNIQSRLVREVAEELLATKRSDGLSQSYLQHLGYDLEKFAKAFACSIANVRGPDVDQWLRQLGVAPRTRNNLRNSVQLLMNFAKARRYLPKDYDELDAVAVVKDRGGEIEIFTPAELQEMLACAQERLIPFLALAAFAGVRHAEIQRLEWKDVRFDDGIIEIHAAKAKTASRRTVPILENLRQWLLRHRETSGPVCQYRNVASELQGLVVDINQARLAAGGQGGFQWKHNALRHSFISYRVAQIQNVAQVALEAGNSPQIIFQHYRELVRPAEAEKWFAIAPDATRGQAASEAECDKG